MDDVERMYRQLVRTVRASSPQLLTQPFPVSDLYSTILPYRLHRRELGVETNQDYEMAMLELLSGARGYLVVDDRMRETLGGTLKSANPDPALIREFATARVSFAPDALHQLDGEAGAASAPAARSESGGSSAAAPPRDAATMPVRTVTGSAPAAATSSQGAAAPPRPSGTTASAPAAPARRPSRPVTIPDAGQECPHCKGALPAGRAITFCPHCGQDLTVQHCPACGSELEHGWKFCVTCGRTVSAA
ncbi:MAG TPA: zinc ribbon domain-containing protein [Gemmatimonadaceae bacterium]|nr:zinc ribbon domain-containing protein [Gemmatimonadaceae bacterium]